MGKPKKSSTPEKEVRSFTVSFIKVDDKNVSSDYGRYTSKSGPIAAARKVASAAFRSKKAKSTKPVTVCIRETTSGKEKKLYTYTFKKVRYKEPQGPFNATFKVVQVGKKRRKKRKTTTTEKK